MFPSVALIDPAGPIALGERSVIITTLLLSALVIIPVFTMLGVFAWRYRAGNLRTESTHHPEWDHTSAIAEVTWWLIPAVIIAILSVVAWRSSHALDPYVPIPGDKELVVQVVALNWKWLFVYPQQDIASVNLLEIPVNTPVHLFLTADAPINTIWIPQLAGQIMVMPGMTTQLYLEATRAGDYRGLSGNISGAGFSGMTFTARAVTPEEFSMWAAARAGAGRPLTIESYAALAAPSTDEPIASFAPVQSNIFSEIIGKYRSSTSTESHGSMQMTP